MEIKSTLNVFSEESVAAVPGSGGHGHIIRRLAGATDPPTERLMVNLAVFEPGAHEKLHWHLIEVFYYVISGRAIMHDIEGRSFEMGPGTVVYAPPGIAGSHSWEVIETLRILGIRATADPQKTIQFDVDPVTKESTMSPERLLSRNATTFKKSMY
jgi:mannose-6-phosphate isomerase-like protein (cupin superfamily)